MAIAFFKKYFSSNIIHYALQFANCNCDMQTKQFEPNSRQVELGELPLEKLTRHV